MEAPAKKHHYFQTLLIIIFVVSFPQYGRAADFQCGYEKCDSLFQFCDDVLDSCAPCTNVCPQNLPYCEKVCRDYYNNHYKKPSTQEPVTEEVESVTTNVNVQETTEENSAHHPALYVFLGIFAVIVQFC